MCKKTEIAVKKPSDKQANCFIFFALIARQMQRGHGLFVFERAVTASIEPHSPINQTAH